MKKLILFIASAAILTGCNSHEKQIARAKQIIDSVATITIFSETDDEYLAKYLPRDCSCLLTDSKYGKLIDPAYILHIEEKYGRHNILSEHCRSFNNWRFRYQDNMSELQSILQILPHKMRDSLAQDLELQKLVLRERQYSKNE